MAIGVGDVVEVTTASGDQIRMRALGGPEQGSDFLVLWVCVEAEYERSERAGDEPDGIPWPMTAVRELVMSA